VTMATGEVIMPSTLGGRLPLRIGRRTGRLCDHSPRTRA
jgi:hypothetical protein